MLRAILRERLEKIYLRRFEPNSPSDMSYKYHPYRYNPFRFQVATKMARELFVHTMSHGPPCDMVHVQGSTMMIDEPTT